MGPRPCEDLGVLLSLALTLSTLGALDFVPKAKVDLDGDGVPEEIEFVALPTGVVAFELRVGDVRLGQRFEEGPEGGPRFAVVDLDAADKSKELLLFEAGPSDLRTHTLVRYEKKKLVVLGSFGGQLPRDPELVGNTFVTFGSWEGFYERKHKLALDAKGRLVEVVPELYAVDVTLKVKQSVAVHTTRAKKELLARPKIGSDVVVVAHDPSPTCKPGDLGFEPCEWFLVRTATGLLGWIELGDLAKLVELPFAG
jgi:hypothetical protein